MNDIRTMQIAQARWLMSQERVKLAVNLQAFNDEVSLNERAKLLICIEWQLGFLRKLRMEMKNLASTPPIL